jgi:cytochrome b6-f complex iron-sulfur subunit
MDRSQSRRGFCTRACWAVSMTAFGGALATLLESCGGGSSPTGATGASAQSLPGITATANGGSIALSIDSSSPLASTGSMAVLQYQSGYLLVARTGDAAFTALSAICTHETCLISARASDVFLCTCHGSTFDTSGRVLGGPARASLRQYPTSFDAAAGTLTISV